MLHSSPLIIKVSVWVMLMNNPSTILEYIKNEFSPSIALGSEDRNVTINLFGQTNEFLDVGYFHLEAEIQLRYLIRMVGKRIPGLLIIPYRNSQAIFAFVLPFQSFGVDDPFDHRLVLSFMITK